jgi:ribosome modulation factor
MDKKRYTAEEWAAFRLRNDTLPIAKQLGRKHRNYGNPRDVNPYDETDPCRQAWFDGWDERDSELPHE